MVSTDVFTRVILDWSSGTGLSKIAAYQSSNWSTVVVLLNSCHYLHVILIYVKHSSLTIDLNFTGYIPSWGTVNVNFIDDNVNLPLTVGYMSIGWNFNFHEDGVVELMSPPLLPDPSFSVSLSHTLYHLP
jgi:hypothetical protein